jgi:ribosomal protein S18 acetylase RimI-like enzyme
MTVEALWETCFPGEKVYRSNPHAVIRAGHVVSMVHWKHMDVCGFKGAYIFGVATHPAHRGEGLASRLISDLLVNLQGLDFAALAAEKTSLIKFYQRFGFTQCGCLPDDGRAVLLKPLRNAVLHEQAALELARMIKNFEDEE